jgi:hypothetical protein
MTISWEYIAGFMDGEGCICLVGNRCKIGIAQGRKQSHVLDVIQGFLLSHDIHCWITKGHPTKNRGNPIDALWMSSRKACLRYLTHVLPYLIVKHDKAIQAIELINPKLAREQDFLQRMEMAIAAYRDGMSSLQIFKKYRIFHAPLRRHLAKRGLLMRSRKEANRLHVSNRSEETKQKIHLSIQRANQRSMEARRRRLAGADKMYTEQILPIATIAARYSVCAPTMRNHLIDCGVVLRPKGYKY